MTLDILSLPDQQGRLESPRHQRGRLPDRRGCPESRRHQAVPHLPARAYVGVYYVSKPFLFLSKTANQRENCKLVRSTI